jgi:hypothetical protein
MFKSISSILALTLLASSAHLLYGMEGMGSKQAQLIALYNDLVKQKKAGPERGYDARGESDMYTMLWDSLKDSTVKKSEKIKGLNQVYQEMLVLTPTEKFSKIFSPHNIQMLAYQQNEFGGGHQYTFSGKLGFTDRAYEPSLIEYTRPDGTTIVVTRYSYFFGMLENIANAVGLAIHADKTTDSDINKKRLMKNIDILEKNIQEANKGAPATLTAKQVGEIAERLTRNGNTQFIKLISTINGVPYTYKP